MICWSVREEIKERRTSQGGPVRSNDSSFLVCFYLHFIFECNFILTTAVVPLATVPEWQVKKLEVGSFFFHSASVSSVSGHQYDFW